MLPSPKNLFKLIVCTGRGDSNPSWRKFYCQDYELPIRPQPEGQEGAVGRGGGGWEGCEARSPSRAPCRRISMASALYTPALP